jgi:hypothetical protein
MNKQMSAKFFIRSTRFFIVMFAGVFLIPAIHAQSVATGMDNRFLLIFDTSADMKKRVPAVQRSLDELLATSARGELRSGDSIGVWTFGQELRTGQFPLQRWDPADAVMIASNINRFVGKQHYAKSTSFDALQPLLEQVVENSERLTVVIYCDGEAGMNGTSFDSGINEVFQQKGGAQKKARQPLVVVLRSQRGEYTGCTVSFPPAAVNLPEFPPLPPPAPKLADIPPPAPAVVPSLVIIGTKVGTNLPPVAPANQTNAVSTPLANPAAPPAAQPSAQTNPAVASQPPPENSGGGGKKPLVVGTVLLVAAGVLTALAVFRARKKDHGSLITRSMREK